MLDIIGPIHIRSDRYDFAVDGCLVPNLCGYKTSENTWELVLIRDGKGTFIYEGFTSEQVYQTVPIVAQAMALAAGYSSFGINGTKGNDYKCQVRDIETEIR